jgi:hypothetical protein
MESRGLRSECVQLECDWFWFCGDLAVSRQSRFGHEFGDLGGAMGMADSYVCEDACFIEDERAAMLFAAL